MFDFLTSHTTVALLRPSCWCVSLWKSRFLVLVSLSSWRPWLYQAIKSGERTNPDCAGHCDGPMQGIGFLSLHRGKEDLCLNLYKNCVKYSFQFGVLVLAWLLSILQPTNKR